MKRKKRLNRWLLLCFILSGVLLSCGGQQNCYERYVEHHADKVVLDAFTKNEKRYGVLRSFYDNGNEKTLASFDNDHLEGVFIGFYENGDVRRVSKYHKEKLEGKRLVFYEGYRIKQKEHYTAGQEDGWFFHYDTLGNVKEKKFYEKGKLISKWTKEKGAIKVDQYGNAADGTH